MKSALGQIYSLYTDRVNYQEAERLLTEAYTAAQQTGNHFVEFAALSSLILIIFYKGELRRSDEMAHQALEGAGSSPSAAVLNVVLSEVFYELNDLETALNHMQQVIELSQQIGAMYSRVQILDLLARFELILGNEAGFLAALEKADREMHSISNRTLF